MGMTSRRGYRPPRPAPPEPEPEPTVMNTIVKIGRTAVQIGTRSTRSAINIFNPGDEPIYVGGPSVSPSDGFPVQPGGYASLDVDADIVLFGVVAGMEEIEARVMEVG